MLASVSHGEENLQKECLVTALSGLSLINTFATAGAVHKGSVGEIRKVKP